MIESIYGSGLLVLALWIATSLFVLGFWGLLAWAVVHLLSRRGGGRNSAVDMDHRIPRCDCSAGRHNSSITEPGRVTVVMFPPNTPRMSFA
jgi:hypothetical protein